MGRSRKPSEMQKGNITVIAGNKRKTEEESVMVGKDQLEKPPTWLVDNVAKKEWRRLVKELEKIDIIGNLDKNNLGRAEFLPALDTANWNSFSASSKFPFRH